MAVTKKPFYWGSVVAWLIGAFVGAPAALFIVEFGRGRGWW